MNRIASETGDSGVHQVDVLHFKTSVADLSTANLDRGWSVKFLVVVGSSILRVNSSKDGTDFWCSDLTQPVFSLLVYHPHQAITLDQLLVGERLSGIGRHRHCSKVSQPFLLPRLLVSLIRPFFSVGDAPGSFSNVCPRRCTPRRAARSSQENPNPRFRDSD